MIALLYLSIFALVFMLKPDLPLWADIIATIVWFVSVILVNARWTNMCERVEELENRVTDLRREQRNTEDRFAMLDCEVTMLRWGREDEKNTDNV